MKMNLRLKQIETECDFLKMAEIIQAKESYFRDGKLGEVIETDDGPIVYKDNGSNILAVAHTDTVIAKPEFHGLFYADLATTKSWRSFNPINPCSKFPDYKKAKKRGRKPNKITPFLSLVDATMIVAASGLDDRLGVFIILEILPQIGVKCDYILTTNEERGRSTAMGFQEHIAKKLNKEYNWFVEFDRRGEDCVTYRYKTTAFTAALKDADFNVGVGSYTDICDMYEHGVCGLNVGVGYHDAHSPDSWFSVDMLYRNLNRFKTFYETHKDTKFKIDTSKWWGRNRTYTTNKEDKETPVYVNNGRAWKSYSFDDPQSTAASTWNDFEEKEYGKDFEYVWFFCPYCRHNHNHVSKGAVILCKCGTEYRRSLTDGEIYRYNKILEKYYLSVVIGKHSESFPIVNMSTRKCSICTEINDKGMSLIDGKYVCAGCSKMMFSECEWCERKFFSLGLKELTLCEECNEILVLYGETNPTNNADARKE